MKRVNTLLGMLVATGLILSACGPASPTPAPTTPPEPAPTQPAAPAEPTKAPEPTPAPTPTPTPQPLEISFMEIAYGTPPRFPSDYTRWLEKELGVKFTDAIFIPSNEYENRQNVMLAADEVPVLTKFRQAPLAMYTQPQFDAIANGMFHELTPYIKDPDFAKKYPNLGKIPQEIWDNITLNGQIWSIPSNLEPPTFNSLCIRRDLFEAAGYKVPDDLPKTIDELKEIILKLTDKQAGIYGWHFVGTNFDGATGKAFINAFTGVHDWAIDDEGNFTFQAFMPEYKDWLNFMRDLYEAGAINPEFALGQNNADWQEKGKAATKTWRWHVCGEMKDPQTGELRPADMKAGSNPDGKIKVINAPPVLGPKAYTVDANRGYFTSYAISSKFPKERIPELLAVIDKWIDDKYTREVVNTLPDELGYTEVKDGKKVFTQKWADDAAGAFTIGIRPWGATVEDWVYHQKTYGNFTDEGIEQIKAGATAQFEGYEKSPGVRPWSLRLYSPTFVAKWGELTAKLNDNRVKYIMGQMTEAEWDAYVKSIVESADYQQIIKEYKEAYLASPWSKK